MKRQINIQRDRRTKFGKTRREIARLLSSKNVKCKMRLGELYTQTLVADGLISFENVEREQRESDCSS